MGRWHRCKSVSVRLQNSAGDSFVTPLPGRVERGLGVGRLCGRKEDTREARRGWPSRRRQ